MNEDEARAWLRDRFGDEACARVAAFLDIVVTENAQQNLISPVTVACIWSRHAVDSAQLLDLAPAVRVERSRDTLHDGQGPASRLRSTRTEGVNRPNEWRSWVDIGTGGGFPGMIVALLVPDRAVTMVEPRRKRADFLRSCCDHFALRYATVEAIRIESVVKTTDIISARAVASVENLLRSARHCAKADTTWLLPRGRSGVGEVEGLTGLQRTMLHVEHSITDPASAIVVLRGDGT